MIKVQSFGVIPFLDSGRNRSFLVVEQKGGIWSFPKGRNEANETPKETAVRELEEETGIKKCEILDGGPFTVNYIINSEIGESIDKTAGYFLGRVENDAVTLQESEIDQYKWLSAEETINLLTYDVTKDMFRLALKTLGQSSGHQL